MRVAVLDHVTTDGNAIGSLTKLALTGLADHDITVFAADSDLQTSEHLRWVRVPALRRPQVALYLTYHLAVPIVYVLWQLRSRRRFDFVHVTESCATFGDLSYVHFCHRAFLRRCRRGGVKLPLARWLDHKIRAVTEGVIYRRRSVIVVPSHNFAEELIEETGVARSSVVVIPNVFQPTPPRSDVAPAHVAWTSPPAADEVVLIFAALGHFDRKGLPFVLEALADPALSSFRLIVVGGKPSTTREYEKQAADLGLRSRVAFVGFQQDLHPWFAKADAFILPSLYEVFSMVCLEAAASGLPLLISPYCGVSELIEDGTNGLVVDAGVDGVRKGLLRFAAMTPAQRQAMGEAAGRATSDWTSEKFAAAWRRVYSDAAVHVAP